MPIYAYRCDSCGFAQDVLRKMSDPPLKDCPQCGKPTFTKQVTAAGFQLKGSGWYVTDFRDNGKKPGSGDGKSAPAVSGSSTSDGGESSSSTGSAAAESGAKSDSKSESGSTSGSASAPSAPAASTAPSSPAASSSSSGSTGKSGA